MNFFDAQTARTELAQRLAAHPGLVVACYCAGWCNTCTAYRQGFETLAAKLPDHVFVWIDIEESEDLLGDEDVEDFPTLLVQSPSGNLFFGPMLPHPEHLERLLQGMNTAQPANQPGPGSLKALMAAQ